MDGVVHPMARQMGLALLGTLHERVGDTAGDPGPGGAGAGSSWGRFIADQIDNQYRAFVEPRDTGKILGGQSGVDLFRDSTDSGERDAAGVYFATGRADAQEQGLVTNADATGYDLANTGFVSLDAYAGGAYWTHYGARNWYVDAVLQGSFYQGDARTQYADLPLRGSGVVTSLEGGYPLALALGPGFVLEPQLQAIWQRVSFKDGNDGLGPVDLGESAGVTGRVGVRGRWSIDSEAGRTWLPYWRLNLWHDWGGASTPRFGDDRVPLLLEEATRVEVALGFTVQFEPKVSLYAQAGYQMAVGGTDGGRRQGAAATVGVRYYW